MKTDHKGASLVILGVISVIAVIGLVMIFQTPDYVVGQVYTSATGGYYLCNIHTNVGEPQWFPVLAGAKEDERLAEDFLRAGYQCSVVRDGEILDYVNDVDELQLKFFAQGGHYVDEFGYQTLCCRNPPWVPVQPRGGNPPVETRRPSGIPAQSETGQRLGP